jgi:hypothetical protein
MNIWPSSLSTVSSTMSNTCGEVSFGPSGRVGVWAGAASASNARFQGCFNSISHSISVSNAHFQGWALRWPLATFPSPLRGGTYSGAGIAFRFQGRALRRPLATFLSPLRGGWSTRGSGQPSGVGGRCGIFGALRSGSRTVCAHVVAGSAPEGRREGSQGSAKRPPLDCGTRMAHRVSRMAHRVSRMAHWISDIANRISGTGYGMPGTRYRAAPIAQRQSEIRRRERG